MDKAMSIVTRKDRQGLTRFSEDYEHVYDVPCL